MGKSCVICRVVCVVFPEAFAVGFPHRCVSAAVPDFAPPLLLMSVGKGRCSGFWLVSEARASAPGAMA
jgi:hypothetical protein